MPRFVIYLSSEDYRDIKNDYGYWTGKVFTGEDIAYPGFENDKTHDNVKIYTNRKRAETMAEKLRFRCSYVVSATVEEVAD